MLNRGMTLTARVKAENEMKNPAIAVQRLGQIEKEIIDMAQTKISCFLSKI